MARSPVCVVRDWDLVAMGEGGREEGEEGERGEEVGEHFDVEGMKSRANWTLGCQLQLFLAYKELLRQ